MKPIDQVIQMKPIDQVIHILSELCQTNDIPLCRSSKICKLATDNHKVGCTKCSLGRENELREHMRSLDETN